MKLDNALPVATVAPMAAATTPKEAGGRGVLAPPAAVESLKRSSCLPLVVSRGDGAEGNFEVRNAYGTVHCLQTGFLSESNLKDLGWLVNDAAPAMAVADINVESLGDREWEGVGLSRDTVAAEIGKAMAQTGVMGKQQRTYVNAAKQRIEALTCRGAAFHNDSVSDWKECLFWVLAIDTVAVEFVVPSVGYRRAICPGDLLVFDPCLPHGLCRVGDGGLMVEASFGELSGKPCTQAFLSGVMELSDAKWRALGCGWRRRDAGDGSQWIDLARADINEQTGLVKPLSW